MTELRATGRRMSALFAAVTLAALPLWCAADSGYQKFLGEYVGEGLVQTDGHVNKRDLKVEIKAKGEGFSLNWVSVTHDDEGELRRKAYTVSFRPTGKGGIYGSAMRTDMFGNQVPLDPLKGEPYVWARIDGETLYVYALIITERGGYEIQTYERTLTAEGMRLKYSRVRDGEILRTVEGTLRRVN